MNIFKFKTIFNKNNTSTLKRNISLLTTITDLTDTMFSIPVLNCSFGGF